MERVKEMADAKLAKGRIIQIIKIPRRAIIRHQRLTHIIPPTIPKIAMKMEHILEV